MSILALVMSDWMENLRTGRGWFGISEVWGGKGKLRK